MNQIEESFERNGHDTVECAECGETVPATAATCPACGYDPEAHVRKVAGYLMIVCAVIGVLFPPSLIVTIPLVVLTYFGARRREWTVGEGK